MRNKIGILVVTDTRDESTDQSGPSAAAALAANGFEDVVRRICEDDVAVIQSNILEMCDLCGAVFTVGGTGFSRRDVTPEATLPLIERQADSISELVRIRGLSTTPFAHLSRGVSGIRGQTLIVNLPGSPAGASGGIQAVAPLLTAILSSLAGEGCPLNSRSNLGP
jgi:molybdopterin adenylyltransferase